MTTTLAEPVEIVIVNDVIEALKTIKSGNDTFYTDPRRIYELYGNALEIDEIPAIIVTPVKSAGSHDCPNGLERVDLTLAITCVTDVSIGGALHDDFSEVHKEIRRMTVDVRKALLVDPQRSGLAIDTKIMSIDIFEAVQSQPVAAAELVITIPFRHQTADPTQAQ